jgi:hypothetical protein
MTKMMNALVIVVAAAAIASILAHPISEGFLMAENALANRFGNAGYGEFDQKYEGGWIVNGYPGLPNTQHRPSLDS